MCKEASDARKPEEESVAEQGGSRMAAGIPIRPSGAALQLLTAKVSLLAVGTLMPPKQILNINFSHLNNECILFYL